MGLLLYMDLFLRISGPLLCIGLLLSWLLLLKLLVRPSYQCLALEELPTRSSLPWLLNLTPHPPYLLLLCLLLCFNILLDSLLQAMLRLLELEDGLSGTLMDTPMDTPCCLLNEASSYFCIGIGFWGS